MDSLINDLLKINENFLSFVESNSQNFNKNLSILCDEVFYISRSVLPENYKNPYDKGFIKTSKKRNYEDQVTKAAKFFLPSKSILKNKKKDQVANDASDIDFLGKKRRISDLKELRVKKNKIFFNISIKEEGNEHIDEEYYLLKDNLGKYKYIISLESNSNVNENDNTKAEEANDHTRPNSFDTNDHESTTKIQTQSSIKNEVFKSISLTSKSSKYIKKINTKTLTCGHSVYYAKGLCKPCYQHQYFVTYSKPMRK